MIHDPFDVRPGIVRAPLAGHYEPLRAQGRLSYLDFIDMVGELWLDANPKIPYVPFQGKNTAKYPALVWALDMRVPFREEPKPRLRQEVRDPVSGKTYLIHAWRFTNIVTFTAVTEKDPRLAEEIIENFEDMMITYTGAIKQAGISELRYYRRYADNEVTRPGDDLNRRTLAWEVTTEKVYQTNVERLEQVAIDLRIFVENNTAKDLNEVGDELDEATPSVRIVDLEQATPNY